MSKRKKRQNGLARAFSYYAHSIWLQIALVLLVSAIAFFVSPLTHGTIFDYIFGFAWYGTFLLMLVASTYSFVTRKWVRGVISLVLCPVLYYSTAAALF